MYHSYLIKDEAEMSSDESKNKYTTDCCHAVQLCLMILSISGIQRYRRVSRTIKITHHLAPV